MVIINKREIVKRTCVSRKMNGKRSFSIFIVFALILSSMSMMNLLVSAEEEPIQEPLQSGPITITYDFEEPTIERRGEYSSIIMPDLHNFGQPGEPRLPIYGARILIPQGEEVETVNVIPGNKRILPGYHKIEPEQEPVHTEHEVDEISVIPPDPMIYGSLNPFPGILYKEGTSGNFRGYSIFMVNLYPVQYIPKSGVVSYYESLTLDISTTNTVGIPPLFRDSVNDEEGVRKIVDNPQASSTYINPSTSLSIPLVPPGSWQYVIITTSTLEPSFDPFILHKTNRGISTNLVYISDILSTYPGIDEQEKIRNFIIDAYENWGTEYILLGADSDLLPVRYLWAESENIPSDIYYAGLYVDGDWNYDGDPFWGESIINCDRIPKKEEADLYADVYVGRVPVDTVSDVDNWVNKAINYENTPVDDTYLDNVMMLGHLLNIAGGGVPICWGGDAVRTIVEESINSDPGMNSYSLLEQQMTPPLYDISGNYKLTQKPIFKMMNGETPWDPHIIIHNGHGTYEHLSTLYIPDVDLLVNPKPFLVNTMSCETNAFDWSTGDSVSEHLIKNPNGAFAYIGNTRYGWYQTGQPSEGPSALQSREFFDALFHENIYGLGKAFQDSKEDLAPFIDLLGEINRYCYFSLNLLGDPEAPMYVEGSNPEISVRALDQDHPDIFPEYINDEAYIIIESNTDLNSISATVTLPDEPVYTSQSITLTAVPGSTYEWFGTYSVTTDGIHIVEVQGQEGVNIGHGYCYFIGDITPSVHDIDVTVSPSYSNAEAKILVESMSDINHQYFAYPTSTSLTRRADISTANIVVTLPDGSTQILDEFHYIPGKGYSVGLRDQLEGIFMLTMEDTATETYDIEGYGLSLSGWEGNSISKSNFMNCDLTPPEIDISVEIGDALATVTVTTNENLAPHNSRISENKPLYSSYGTSTLSGLVMDSDSQSHLFWAGFRDKMPGIYYQKRDVHKKLSSDTASINQLCTPGESEPVAVIDVYDNIHVVWSEGLSSPIIHYMKLNQNGNILVDREVCDSSVEPLSISSTLDSDGDLHLTWLDKQTGTYEVWYMKLDIDGNTIIPEYSLTTGANEPETPSIAADSDGNAHVIWSEIDIIEYDRDIWYTKVGIIPPIAITNDIYESFNPKIASDSLGNIHIIWYELHEEIVGIELKYWLDTHYLKQDSSGNPIIGDKVIIQTLQEDIPFLSYPIDIAIGYDNLPNIICFGQYLPVTPLPYTTVVYIKLNGGTIVTKEQLSEKNYKISVDSFNRIPRYNICQFRPVVLIITVQSHWT